MLHCIECIINVKYFMKLYFFFNDLIFFSKWMLYFFLFSTIKLIFFSNELLIFFSIELLYFFLFSNNWVDIFFLKWVDIFFLEWVDIFFLKWTRRWIIERWNRSTSSTSIYEKIDDRWFTSRYRFWQHILLDVKN